MDGDGFAEGWRVWTEGEHRIVLAFRPDVFDGRAFPAACMPTIYLSRGRRSRRPGAGRTDADRWFVTLYLEPEVAAATDEFETRAAALSGARDLADRFARGEVDYRGAYQVPRPDYLDRLDELTGREA